VSELDAYLDRVLVGGRDPSPAHIEIAPPDPAWPRRFAEHRDRIAAALGSAALQLEHVGSTAVPGLAAKPVVDVLVTVADPDAEDRYLPALLEAGYALRVREPGHRMLTTEARDVHVHVWAAGSPEAAQQLALRDLLRRSPAARERYEAEKRRLAMRSWPTADHYAEAKSPVIAELLQEAASALGPWT